AALVAVNTSVGRGSTSFDLNTIPTASIDRVEVLRDGASAQYGADAIAGVINIRLREAREGGALTFNYGIYDTNVPTSRGNRDERDGLTQSLSGWVGLPLGAEGFVTISGEAAMRHPTNRSDFTNVTALPLYGAPVLLGRFGDPDIKSGTVYVNAGLPLSDTWDAYGYGGYQRRDSSAAATARAYNNSGNVPAVYPLGFLPLIETEIEDWTVAGGVKGEFAGFNLDIGASYGRNDLRYDVANSINASFGTASPRNFFAGTLGYDQWLLGVDASREFEVGLANPLNVAFGVEYRAESFEIGAGEPASYTLGPDTTKAPVSQGFPGFRPANEVDVSRDSIGAYIDLEADITDRLSLDAAARFEDFSDFGEQTTGKLSGRFEVTDALAVRGAISSGFKAPALQQQYFTYTSTNNVLVGSSFQLIEVGTFPVSSAVARALGAKPLEPETSTNYSLGFVYQRGAFELTVDAYQIDLENRIVLSENLPTNVPAGPTKTAIEAILAPFGVSAARFFINGVDTTTKGVDVVARYRLDLGESRLNLTAAANFNSTEVTKTPDLPTLTSLPQPPFLFDRANVLTYEEGTPERKIVLNADWSLGPWGVRGTITNYDSVLLPNNNAAFDYGTGPTTLLDLEASYEMENGFDFAVGVNNATDQYPQYTPGTINSPTGSIGFPAFSPFGFNGRFFYGRVSYNW
ncbi:MAG TPA: TonB-dependent receptor, partial [Phenylobacterium sp.]